MQEILGTLFEVKMSVGSIATLEQAVNNTLAVPVAEALGYVQEQHMRNEVEIGWREKAKRLWLWICTTPLVTMFRVLASRSAASAKASVGEDFPGVMGIDRYGAYNWVDPQRRQGS